MSASRPTQVVVQDGYDRELFARLYRTNGALRQTAHRIERVLPHAEDLLRDVFAVLFKLNVVLLHPSEVAASAQIHRRLVEAVLASSDLTELKNKTELDPERSAEVVIVLGERILKALTREHRVLARELAETAEGAALEAELETKKAERADLDALAEHRLDPSDRQKTQDALEQEIRALERDLEGTRDRQKQVAHDLPLAVDQEIAGAIRRLPEEISSVDVQIRALGLGGGKNQEVDARTRVELGERLATSKKLRLLARLTGAFREVATEARKRRIARAPQEAHAIRTGRDLARLLPSELLGLRRERRGLHLDFLRRFSDGGLLQYDLTGPASRGPMVVCVDGSSSMQGSKELWAKAVALTLMDIARRERRRCLAIVFADGPELFRVELVAGRGGRKVVQDRAVLDFAEHFPGGGTAFEPPLVAALEAVTEGTYRRGDIVFITDGQASVSDSLVSQIDVARTRHRFRIRSIEVDVEQSQRSSLARFSDDVRSVSELAADSLADLFAAV